MKSIARKSLLAIAVASTLASSAFAQTAPSVTLYGRMDLAVESVSYETAYDGALTKTMLQNYASRFGIKGDRSFSKDLTGIFQVESAFSPEDGKAQNQAGNTGFLASRNSFVGLKSNSMGTFLIGNHDTPLKALDGGGLASTLWAEGDALEVIIHGKGTKSTNSTYFDNVHTRQTNNLVYISPKFSDIVVKASYSPDEAQTADTTAAKAINQPLMSVSGEWNNGTYNFGLAYQKKDVTGKKFGMSATKVTMGAKMGDFTAGLAFSALDNNAIDAANSQKTNNSLIVLGYTMGPTLFKFNYGMSGASKSTIQDDLTMTSLEVDYVLDKQTTLYANYAQIMNNTNAKGTFTGADNVPGSTTTISKIADQTAGSDPTALSFGIRYNF